MKKIKKMLVAVDFTKFSDQAIDYTRMIAHEFNAKILLFHVIEQFTYSVSDTIQVVDHYTTLKGIALQMLEDRKKKLKKRGLTVDTLVVKGNPSMEIVKQSKKICPDLIVMGSHGRTGLQSLLLGSVTERVVRMASCPVITVKIGKVNNKKRQTK